MQKREELRQKGHNWSKKKTMCREWEKNINFRRKGKSIAPFWTKI